MWRRTIFCDESILRTNGAVKTWVSKKPHERWFPECLAPRLFSTTKTVMVRAAIWHGGRSELKRFERTEFSGARGGVTAMDYRNQITLAPLDEAWKDLRTLWRGYGVPRILEDNCKVHTAPVNRDAAKRGDSTILIILPTPPTSIPSRMPGLSSSGSLPSWIPAPPHLMVCLRKLSTFGWGSTRTYSTRWWTQCQEECRWLLSTRDIP